MTPLAKRHWAAFAPLLLLFLLLRLLQAASACGSFDLEEGFTITAAHELVHHNVWPYQTYQLSAFEGGSLVMVLLSAPLCWLLGPSIFALKLAAIAVSCVTLTGVFLLCRELFGLRGAILGCLLYIFFPSPVYAYSMTAHGFHPDSVAAQVMFLWGVVRCYRHPPSVRRFVWVGALGGFAVYFAYISVIIVAAALAPWVWQRLRRRPDAPRLLYLPLAGGLLAGALPMVVYNVANGFAGLRTYHGSVLSYLYNPTGGEGGDADVRAHTLECLLRFSDMGGYGKPPYPVYPYYPLFDVLFWIVALGALLVWPAARLLRKKTAPGATPFFEQAAVLFFGLTVFIFFASGHPVERWHVVPLLVVLLVVVAGRLDALWGHGRAGKVAAVLLLAAFVAQGVRTNVADIRPRWLGMALKVDGRRYIEFLSRAGTVFFSTGRERLEPALAAMELNLPVEATLLDMANDAEVGRGLLEQVWQAKDPLSELRTFIRLGPTGGVKIDRYKAAGITLARMYLEQKVSAAELATFAAAQGGRGAGAMMEAVGAGVGQKILQKEGIAALRVSAMKPRWLRHFAHGMGRTNDLSTVLHREEPLCLHPQLPRSLQNAYVRGMGRGVARRLLAAVPSSVEQGLCPRVRPWFWAGVKQHGAPTAKLLPLSPGID